MSQTVQQNDYAPSEEETRQRRSAALSNLQRAQQNRAASPEPDTPNPAADRRANRLSFNGSDSFLEQAVARRTAQSPPVEQPNFTRGHSRSASSTSSSQSVMLSEFNKRMTSPSTGLTLVLSQPGDSFPSPTMDKALKRLTIRTDKPATESDSSNSSPRTPPSEDNTSESYSFESVTTAYTEDGKDGSPLTRLNPSAPAFNPIPMPVRQVSGPIFRPGSPAAAKPIRQPKGPCSEDQMDTLVRVNGVSCGHC
jgi:hypothetical protein